MQQADRHQGLEELGRRSSDASKLLSLISNEKRLLILCGLMVKGEMSVLNIAKSVGLGQSALSQHLALMRAAGIVNYRRDAQQLFYYVSEARVIRLLENLCSIIVTDPDER